MSVLKESQHLKISLKDIKTATKNFQECIGIGGYGMVYKGQLSVDGKPTTVAVKRLNEQYGQGLKEFLTEIQLLTGQNHPNLIALIGYCDEGKEKIIVYEYAENGSLDKYLRRDNTVRVLSWLERLRICVDAARGLSHLHYHVGKHQSVIHRDIKSSNILLDHNWNAKISDLGLSKLSLSGLNRSSVISNACGTRSYCEPEYMSTGVVRKESDVYSFGMVLFEVICGRMCVVIDADGFLLSASLVKDYYKKKKLNKIVDPALSGQLRFESMNIFLSIAHQCLHDDRELRPPMSVVMEELDDLLKLELLHLSGALEASSTISSSMAKVAMAVAVVRNAVSKLSDAIRHVIKKTWEFKSQLTQIEETIRVNKPIINKWQKLNELLDRPQEEIDMFIGQLKGAEHLVLKCEHIEQNFYKRYRQSLKLEDLNASLLRFFRIDVQLQEARDVKEVLEVVKDVQKRMEKQSFSGWSPLLKGAVVGLDDQVSTLKRLVFRDSAINDCSVVVVTAARGCGKTTLVTKFCHDPEVQGKFRRHIYFATISSTPSLKVIIKKLMNQGGQQSDFTSDEDAIHQWGSFLGENKSEVLLVLDDVRDASIVTAFKFKSPGYKILVTSRSTFAQFRTYRFGPLNDYDSTNLLRYSAFSKGGSKCCCIPNDLVYKLMKGCKRHPLALSVIGGLLKGTHVSNWHAMVNKLREGPKSVLDVDEDIQLRLARSLDMLKEGSEIKECYLDLGLFPEDQKIAATTLMDIWIGLYKHDEKGLATLNNLFELSFKNLVTLLPIRKDLFAIANYCDEIAVMQHDMMRMLAINVSSQEPAEHRKRLIINAKGQDLPQLPQTIKARLLSISTDEAFSFKWNKIQAPKVEVLVLNFTSKIYAFPQFMQNMENLTVLIITNYGYYFSDLHNFPAAQYLSRLTSIRLEHVSISSISTSLLGLVNLQRLSLIMCKVGNTFDETNLKIPNKFPSLLELDIDSCDDFVTFPTMLCNAVRLKKLSITNCHELSLLSGEFGNLSNLEVLRLASCSNLRSLPDSITNLQKLSIIDLSYCLHLCNLPTQIGKLGNLRTIHVRGCTGLHELPVSVKDLDSLEVICDEEIALLRSYLKHVKLQLIE